MTYIDTTRASAGEAGTIPARPVTATLNGTADGIVTGPITGASSTAASATAATDASTESTIQGRARRRGSRLPLWIGLLVAALIAAGGSAYVLTRSAIYSASRTVVVVPASTVSIDQTASLYDSLSRGQVVATAAQLLGQSRWHANTPDVTVSAGEVAPSSLVLVTARGSDAQQVTSALDEVVTAATPRINTLLKPYAVSAVDTQATQVTKVGLSTPLQLIVVALAALLGGLATGALVARIRRPRS